MILRTQQYKGVEKVKVSQDPNGLGSERLNFAFGVRDNPDKAKRSGSIMSLVPNRNIKVKPSQDLKEETQKQF